MGNNMLDSGVCVAALHTLAVGEATWIHPNWDAL